MVVVKVVKVGAGGGGGSVVVLVVVVIAYVRVAVVQSCIKSKIAL